MKIYQYDSYDEYVAAQVEANMRKLKNIWVDKRTIEAISKRHSRVDRILCHGTRNAAEQKYFQEFFPLAEIIGTEISPTAVQFPMTVQWNFHETNPSWIGKMDIVYSNAIDHSYDPVLALTTWANQVTNTGRLYVEHAYAPEDNHARASDPLEIHDPEIRQIIKDIRLVLEDTFDTTGIKGRCPCRVYVIKH